MEKIEAAEILKEKLADILVKWPLYRIFSYSGYTCHETEFSGSGQMRSGFLPKQIRAFCDHEDCGYETLWQVENSQVYFSRSFIHERSYKCRNCGQQQLHYCFIWVERKEDNLFLKIGQYPELEERIPGDLQQALDGADLKLYKNALRMRNFNLGVAAVAYLRRVVENRMNDMLEILHEAAITHNAPAEVVSRHLEMKAEKRFSTKIDYAGILLPASLRPEGKPNPMSILHELASDGLHSKSDAECVDIFDACRRTFEYVFGKLRIETADAKNFVNEMANLARLKDGTAKNH